MPTKNISSFSTSALQNSNGYHSLIILSMFYMSIMLCCSVLTSRYIGTNEFFVLGGVFISPFIFILDDIIAEIYGYKTARCVILTGFAAQILFIVLCQLVIASPSPASFTHETAYTYILGSSLLRMTLSSFVAYITANLINCYILTRWKLLLKGRKFWLRSIGASLFSEGLYSFFAILMMKVNAIPLNTLLKIIFVSYLIKASYSIAFSVPSNWLVNYIKRSTGIDVYDFPKKFTPSNAFLNAKGNVVGE